MVLSIRQIILSVYTHQDVDLSVSVVSKNCFNICIGSETIEEQPMQKKMLPLCTELKAFARDSLRTSLSDPYYMLAHPFSIKAYPF